MSNLIKAHSNLLYTVNLDFPVSSYEDDEIQAIIEEIAFNTHLHGYEMYTINPGCDFNKRRYRKSARQVNQITFNFVVNTEGLVNGDEVVITASDTTSYDSHIKVITDEQHIVEAIAPIKQVKAISDSPVDKAIANVVNILETREGKKGYYRAIQKALKTVKDFDKSLVPVKLNAKTSDLTACAKALRKYTAQ